MPSRLPLFPLKVVLFPGALLPLHIFEPRYRRLLTDVTAGDRRFGMLPPGPDDDLPVPGTIGCEALVRAVQPLPDGRANIVVGGERRFALVGTLAADAPYVVGTVEWVEDAADTQVPTAEEIARLRDLGERYARALHELRDQELEVTLPDTTAGLSFGVAALTEWDFDAQHRFLGIRSATERVVRLLHALPPLVAAAQARAAVHAGAKRNGQGGVPPAAP